MLQIQYVFASPIAGAAKTVLPENPEYLAHSQEPRRLQFYWVGCKADTQQVINRLHVLGYADYFEWNRVVAIPDGGLVIQRDQGGVLRYLQRVLRN